jgi:hypothetical protein
MSKSTANIDDDAYATSNPPKLPGQDDSSVATDPRDNLPVEKLRETIEFFLRVEYSASNDDKNANIPVMKLHREFLLAIWGAFTPGIIMYDKNNKHVTQHVLSNITSLPSFNKHFDTHFRRSTNKRPARHTIVMKLKSHHTVNEIRNHDAVDKFTFGKNIKLALHPYPDYIIDTSSPGWLYGKHPRHHDRDTIKENMISDIEAACPGATVPFFHISLCNPEIEHEDTKYEAKALCLNVERKKLVAFHHLLKKTYCNEGNPLYVPWNAKSKDKACFLNAIKAQSSFLQNCWVVPVHGVTESQMNSLLPHFSAVDYIQSVERSRTTVQKGRWEVVTERKNFKQAQAAVRDILNNFDKYVPSDDTKLPPSWTKWSDQMPTDEDSSNGDMSFLTTSARSFASIVSNLDLEKFSDSKSVPKSVSAQTTTTALTGITSPTADSAINAELRSMRELLQNQAELLQTQSATIKTMNEKYNHLLQTKEPRNQEEVAGDIVMGDSPQSTDQDAPSNENRLAKMEENILQIMAMMNSLQYPMAEDQPKPKPKRNQGNDSTDISVDEPTSKKANHNGTPMKTSPPLEQATAHHDP